MVSAVMISFLSTGLICGEGRERRVCCLCQLNNPKPAQVLNPGPVPELDHPCRPLAGQAGPGQLHGREGAVAYGLHLPAVAAQLRIANYKLIGQSITSVSDCPESVAVTLNKWPNAKLLHLRLKPFYSGGI